MSRNGYALKHGTGKRTTFSQAQEDIMIEFHYRQAINGIRAEPKDVMTAMEEAGLEVLSVNFLKRFSLVTSSTFSLLRKFSIVFPQTRRHLEIEESQ